MYKNGKNIFFANRSVRSLNFYLNGLRKSEPLTTDGEYKLWQEMQNGSRSAREKLINANRCYVVSVAKRYIPSGAPLEDLIQAGNEGLIKAVDKFDASLGFRLITLATWYIENEVCRTANDYRAHKVLSLDETIKIDGKKETTRLSFLSSTPSQSADWNLRYTEALNSLKECADKRIGGLAHLIDALHQMCLEGYSISDFARRYHLNKYQLNCLLDIIREEAGISLGTAA